MTALNKTVLLVGCGNMGRAMLQGWIATATLDAAQVHVVEPAAALRDMIAGLGVTTHADVGGLPAGFSPSIVMFAVKPQIMLDIVPAYTHLVEKGAVAVSIAAGVGTRKLQDVFGQDAAIVRVMPNTPAAISKGMMVVFNNANVTEDQAASVETLMAASGAVTHVNDEALMDAVTAVSGSGPAYVFHMIEALRAAGIAAGLPEKTAHILAEQTVYGAASYAKASDADPSVLREQVTSPNGTTAAALDVLMKDDALQVLMQEAVKAAKKRSEELG